MEIRVEGRIRNSSPWIKWADTIKKDRPRNGEDSGGDKKECVKIGKN